MFGRCACLLEVRVPVRSQAWEAWGGVESTRVQRRHADPHCTALLNTHRSLVSVPSLSHRHLDATLPLLRRRFRPLCCHAVPASPRDSPPLSLSHHACSGSTIRCGVGGGEHHRDVRRHKRGCRRGTTRPHFDSQACSGRIPTRGTGTACRSVAQLTRGIHRTVQS